MPAINNVPEDKVGKVVQSFIDDDGATKIDCEKNPGPNPPTWTVTADVPGGDGAGD